MKTAAILVAVIAAASAALVVPRFEEFKDGLLINVHKWQPKGQENPSFNVTIFNPTENDVYSACFVQGFLPEAENMGQIYATSDDPHFYPRVTSAYMDFSIHVPPMSARVYTFTKKVYSGYN
jgi:hypothetical protein